MQTIKIKAPALNSSSYGENIQQQFENIDTNFQTLANVDYFTGAPGKGLDVVTVKISSTGDFEYTDENEILTDFDKTSIQNAFKSYDKTDYAWFYNKIYTLYIEMAPVGVMTKHLIHNIYPIIYTKTETDITGKSTDLNYYLDFKYDNNYVLTLEQTKEFPSLYYNDLLRAYCWRINGQETNIIAQGQPGKDGQNGSGLDFEIAEVDGRAEFAYAFHRVKKVYTKFENESTSRLVNFALKDCIDYEVPEEHQNTKISITDTQFQWLQSWNDWLDKNAIRSFLITAPSSISADGVDGITVDDNNSIYLCRLMPTTLPSGNSGKYIFLKDTINNNYQIVTNAPIQGGTGAGPSTDPGKENETWVELCDYWNLLDSLENYFNSIVIEYNGQVVTSYEQKSLIANVIKNIILKYFKYSRNQYSNQVYAPTLIGFSITEANKHLLTAQSITTNNSANLYDSLKNISYNTQDPNCLNSLFIPVEDDGSTTDLDSKDCVAMSHRLIDGKSIVVLEKTVVKKCLNTAEPISDPEEITISIPKGTINIKNTETENAKLSGIVEYQSSKSSNKSVYIDYSKKFELISESEKLNDYQIDYKSNSQISNPSYSEYGVKYIIDLPKIIYDLIKDSDHRPSSDTYTYIGSNYSINITHINSGLYYAAGYVNFAPVIQSDKPINIIGKLNIDTLFNFSETTIEGKTQIQIQIPYRTNNTTDTATYALPCMTNLDDSIISKYPIGFSSMTGPYAEPRQIIEGSKITRGSFQVPGYLMYVTGRENILKECAVIATDLMGGEQNIYSLQYKGGLKPNYIYVQNTMGPEDQDPNPNPLNMSRITFIAPAEGVEDGQLISTVTVYKNSLWMSTTSYTSK